MKIVIYQIVPEQDSKQLIYRNLEAFQKICLDRFPSELYEPVFDGEVDAADLEEVYYIFNMAHPEGYRGRSLSVSCLLYTSPSPRDRQKSRMPSSA